MFLKTSPGVRFITLRWVLNLVRRSCPISCSARGGWIFINDASLEPPSRVLVVVRGDFRDSEDCRFFVGFLFKSSVFTDFEDWWSDSDHQHKYFLFMIHDHPIILSNYRSRELRFYHLMRMARDRIILSQRENKQKMGNEASRIREGLRVLLRN